MGARKAMRERNRLLQMPDTQFDANSWLGIGRGNGAARRRAGGGASGRVRWPSA